MRPYFCLKFLLKPDVVPFLPASFTVWPWSFPSFAVVGTILLHLAYLGFKWLEKAEKPAIL